MCVCLHVGVCEFERAGAAEVCGTAVGVGDVVGAVHVADNKLGTQASLAFGQALRERQMPADVFSLRGVELSNAWEELGLPQGASKWNNEKVLAYWHELRTSGAAVQPRVKLMLVGSGNVGKSTLLHRLRTGEYKDSIPFTDGVDVRDWAVVSDKGEVQIVAWDFGGQPIYMASHPLFFTADCIYLVIWNPRALQLPLDKELSGYVNSVRSRAGADAPIVFVSTHADAGVRQDITAALDALGESRSLHFHISSLTGDGVEQLQRHVGELAAELGARKQHALPTSFLKLERELVALRPKAPCGVLPLTETSTENAAWHAAEDADVPAVQKVAIKCGIADKATLTLALEVLMQRGSVLHFKTDELKHCVFADPQALAHLIATTITCEDKKCAHIRRGILEHNDALAALWASFPAKLRPSLLNFLYHCEVAYPLPDGTGSLIPAMLPEDPPPIKASWLEHGAHTASLEVTLDKLPPDLFSRLLVRTSRFAVLGSSWRCGVLLQRGEERAVVELDQIQAKLTIKCAGHFPMGLRGLIYQAVEHLLAQWFNKIASKLQMSCPHCAEWACSSQKLAKSIRMGKARVECNECAEEIAITDLAPGVVPLNEAELMLKQDLASPECRPERLEMMRRDVLRVLRSSDRLGGCQGRSHPLLWTAMRGQDGAEAIVGVCEHPDGWHPVAGMQVQLMSPDALESFKASEYYMLVAPALQKLMPEVDTVAAVGYQGAGEPLCGPELARFLARLHESCAGDEVTLALRRVTVKGGAPQWLCAEHALLHRDNTNSTQYAQWKVEQDNGELLAYDTASNTALERAFQAAQVDLEIGIGSRKYRIINLLSCAPSSLGPPPVEQQGAIQTLQEMGFPRSSIVDQLLIKHQNNLGEVINELTDPRQGRCVQENQATKKTRGVFRRVYHAPYPVPPPLNLDVPVQRVGQPFQLHDVDDTSALWHRICKRVKDSLPMFKVVRIEQVLNAYLWERYCTRSYELARNNKVSHDPHEKELFHVSQDLNAIIEGTNGAGLDPRLKKPGGCEYGNGVYFAASVAYCAAYSQGWLFEDQDPSAGEVQVLMALVSLGDCKDFGPLCTSRRGDNFARDRGAACGLKDSWKEGNHRNRGPPKDMADKNSALYDSVCGTEGNLTWSPNKMMKGDGERLGKQYVVFDVAQSYPYLRITLKC